MKGLDISAISEVDDEDVFSQKPAPVGRRDTLVEVEGQLSESRCRELVMLPKRELKSKIRELLGYDFNY